MLAECASRKTCPPRHNLRYENPERLGNQFDIAPILKITVLRLVLI